MSEPTSTWIARIRSVGSVDIPIGDVEDLVTFRRELRRAARSEGLTIGTAIIGRCIFAWNPDHQISDDQRHALVPSSRSDSRPHDGRGVVVA